MDSSMAPRSRKRSGVFGAIVVLLIFTICFDVKPLLSIVCYMSLTAVAVFLGFSVKLKFRSNNINVGPRFQDRLSYSQEVEEHIRSKLDMRISGSAVIDEILHEMIDYVFRDHIHWWYDAVSDDDQFVYELRRRIQETFVSLSSRIKETDWIPYLTTQLVDDSASHIRLYRNAQAKANENPNYDLITVFFDMEAKMEGKFLCRDMVSLDDTHLHDYLEGISETLLYLLLPHEVYACTSVGTVAQNLLAHYVLKPVLKLLSDPDYINQYIIWLCQNFPISSDIFLSVIRTSDNMEEILAAHAYFRCQLQAIKKPLTNAKFSKADDDSTVKGQISSLNRILKCLDQRLSILKEGTSDAWGDGAEEQWRSFMLTSGIKLPQLSLEDILADKHSIALASFLDHMAIQGGTNYCLLYFNIVAWKNSSAQQFSEVESYRAKNPRSKEASINIQAMLECMKDAAENIYKQFLVEHASHKVRLPENIVKKCDIALRTETINPNIFDELQANVLNIIMATEKFYPGFLKSKLYVKCLMELDILNPCSFSISGSSDDEYSEEVDSLGGSDRRESAEELDASIARMGEHQTCKECIMMQLKSDGYSRDQLHLWEREYLEKKISLYAKIIEAALSSEKGKQFGLYAVQVTRKENGNEYKWHVYRRYSDFYDFYCWIKSKWMRLNSIEFPSKQPFRSTDRSFLEKRMNALNKFLESILEMTEEQCFGQSLQDALLHFLEPGPYIVRKKQLSDKLDDFFINPLKKSVKNMTYAVKSAPDTFINTFDEVTKFFNAKSSNPSDLVGSMKVGASLDADDTDNIPLRIVLLMLDEVFDLRSRNQWLRRRIVALVQEILKAMYGDTMNRRIVDYVSYLTSPARVSDYLRSLKLSLWPPLGSSPNTRDDDTKMRARIAAKAALFSSVSDDLKRLMGSETTRKGLLTVFDACQNQVLNRRFTLTIFEGILKTLFPDKPIAEAIRRLHFRSNRVGRNRPFMLTNRKAASKKILIDQVQISPGMSRKKDGLK